VEDVLQDAIEVLMKKWIDRIIAPDDDYPRAFMCVVLQRSAQDAGSRLRTEHKHHAAHLDDTDEIVVTDGVSTEAVALADLARQEIYAAIRALPPQQRQIVQLRKIGGLSTKQVAQQLEIKPSAVTTSMTKAMKKLRTLLSSELLTEFENAHPRSKLLSQGGGVA
jgi:RNA polymerase sigma factor (sigma-70 family)